MVRRGTAILSHRCRRASLNTAAVIGAVVLGLALAVLGGPGKLGSAHAQAPFAGSICRDKGLGLHFQSAFPESYLGREVSPEAVFGSGWPNGRKDTGLRTFGRAPDGSVAIQYNIPEGKVPGVGMAARVYKGGGVEIACFEAKQWLPEDFRFPAKGQCVGNKKAGKGRWELGLWSGPPGNKRIGRVGGGLHVRDQKSVPIRLNRDFSGPSGQDARFVPYIYELNRKCPAYASTEDKLVRNCFGTLSEKYASQSSPRGRWATVSVVAEMNDAGKDNGCVELWLEGRSAGKRCGLDLGRDRGYLFQGFVGISLWHCNGSPKAQNYWVKDLAFYGD